MDADALLAVVPDPIVCFAERGLHADAAIRPARRCEPRHGGLDHIGPPCRWRALGVFALRKPVRHQARLAADFLRRARARAEHRFCRGTNGPLRRVVDRGHYRAARRRGRDGHRERVFRRRRSHRGADLVVVGRRGFATAARCCAWPAPASSRWAHALRAPSRVSVAAHRRRSLEQKMVTSCI